jgi:serine/threonine-protein kinase
VTLPDRIGRYRVLDLLGKGAMGIVYRGRDEALERDVALKVMLLGAGADAESRARFEREAKAAAKLQHPNIITIYELGVHENSPFMALELLEGVDLQRAIEAGLRPDPKVTMPIVLQLLAGLGHAHEKGIVHRDVKPSNVFLPRGRPAKIMDFGVARLASGMTTAGMVVGTPNYMSPEQVRAGALDGRSDLFSAGLILYELVTGEKAYAADSVVALLYKIVHEEPDLALMPRGPAWKRLRAILARALQREPEDRYSDAAAMIGDLELAFRDLGGGANWATASDAALIVKTAARPAALVPTATPAPPPMPVMRAPAPPAAAGPGRPVFLAAAGLGVAAVAVVGIALYSARGPATRDATTAAPASVPLATPMPLPPAAPSPNARPAAPPSKAPAAVMSPAVASAPVNAAAHAAVSSPSVRPSLAALPAPVAPVSTTEVTPSEPAPENAALERAEDFFEKGRYAQALSEAKAVLKREPRNSRAKMLAEDAEVELVADARIREAQAALKRGDKDAALESIKAGLAVKPSDSRLLDLWKEATRE